MRKRGTSYAGPFVVAAVLHACAVLGFGVLLRPAADLAISDGGSVELSLVEAAAPLAVQAAPEPEPVPPQPSPPEPAPVEPPPPAPLPEPSSSPERMVKPEPPKPKSAPRSSAPRRAPAVANPATGAPGDAATAPGVTSKAQPNYLSNPAPSYPPPSRANKEQGVVILSVSVSADGRASSVNLARSSGFPLLDQAALAAVRNWRFSPGRVGGVAVASAVTVPVRFRLDQN